MQLGYQVSQRSEVCVNNAGDPFVESFYKNNSHEDERELIRTFCSLFLPNKDSSSLWGYCGSGSTEAILNGLWTARKRFPTGTPLFASEDCHFCVPKIADMLCIPFVPVRTNAITGSMSMKHLHELVLSSTHAIVLLTLGTTIRNGYDPPILFPDFPLPRTNVHIHLDAAFGGVVTDLTKYNSFDTFNVSFHKFLGCPYPCALYLTHRTFLRALQGVGCFGAEMVCLPNKDFTVSCSRNGTAVTFMRRILCDDTFMSTHRMNISQCFINKQYLIHTLRAYGFKCRSVEDGLSVEIFDVNTDPKKYGLSVRNKTSKNTFDTHVYVTSHVTQELLKEFVNSLSNSSSVLRKL